MIDTPKPFPKQGPTSAGSGVAESPTLFVSKADQHRLTLEALEEYRRTGESADAGPALKDFVANVRRRVIEKR